MLRVLGHWTDMARTRAQDFEEKQLALLDYAAQTLATLGVDKASMSQIAKQANVSKALLYHYYPSKDALVFAIIFTHLEALDADLAASDNPAMRPTARLKLLVSVVLENYRGADDRHRVQLNAMSMLTDEQRQTITEVERRIVRRFASTLREIRPDLDSKDRPLVMPVTMSLFGMLNWMYMWFRDGGQVTREDYASIVTALILKGIKAVR
ncbi:TetR/AcrR family transcriptional regulator [Lysobacter sp. CA199]|uniref:TetR/AcrR family transcriptional regulator n=1 Tax=Lysobacter sp. CA199 TaxID=3455608 RepID=UPI003F8D2BE0